MFEYILAGGLVVDGTGGPARPMDVGIERGTIIAVGNLAGAETRQTVAAAGMIVAPGFIDIHTHSDVPVVVDGRCMSKLHQGVTTDVIGNCGYTPYPITPERMPLLKPLLGGDKAEWDWADLQGYRARVMRQGVGMNVAPLVGHSAIRGSVVGFDDRPATPDETKAMERLVYEAMDQGAFGLSTGLTLPPSAYGDTEEIVALAQAMATYPGRFYTSHIRGWAGNHLAAVDEAIEIGRRAGVPVQVSHMAVNDPKHWGEAGRVIGVCERGIADGVDVTFDVYPYAASSSGFSQCMPTWAQSGGLPALAARLREPESRARVHQSMLEEGVFRGWPWLWDRLLVCGVDDERAKPYEGMTLQQAGEAMGVNPIDAALTLMDWDNARMRVIFFYRTEEDMRTFLRHPLSMVGSDGSAIAADGPLSSGKPHPRSYGAAARMLGRYVRDEAVLTLEEAVYKMSGRVADRLGLKDRGRIAPGQAADIVIFDPATVLDRADFQNPHQYAAGVPYVFVNGILAIEEGVRTASRSGQVLAAS